MPRPASTPEPTPLRNTNGTPVLDVVVVPNGPPAMTRAASGASDSVGTTGNGAATGPSDAAPGASTPHAGFIDAPRSNTQGPCVWQRLH